MLILISQQCIAARWTSLQVETASSLAAEIGTARCWSPEGVLPLPCCHLDMIAFHVSMHSPYHHKMMSGSNRA